MNEEQVRKYEDKKCLIILNNNFKYTATLPKKINSSFSIIDKFGREVTIDCDFIAMIQEVKDD